MFTSDYVERELQKFMKTKAKDQKDEEWIWVKGYKGMDKDMKCHGGFQYELGESYDMPEDKPVQACYSGFHLCLNLVDVFDFVSIENGNRFFEVEALVRMKDVERYGNDNHFFFGSNNKLAAKSIVIVRELTVDEILEPHPETENWSVEAKRIAIEDSFQKAMCSHHILTLVKMGYAEPLASYICNKENCRDGYNLAVALASQPDISMDTKINAIFSHI